jgi:hypothetical protein
VASVQSSVLQRYLPTSTTAYVPRNPLQGKVFQVIQKHWKKFELETSSNDQPLSQYVKREFEAFLGCGILSKGFMEFWHLILNTDLGLSRIRDNPPKLIRTIKN